MVNLEEIKQNKTIQELLEFGIINIDKPSNPTSFDVSDFVRKKLGLRKTSHFGTLDPKVTGVLPIALNRACKLTGFFLGEDKEYVGVMRVHEEILLEKLRETIKKKFLGKILQVPPVKSRVKREEREREIKSFELLEKDERNILFRAEVQGGTYIRKLIDDLGKELGIGAHMLELRRIRAGIFMENENFIRVDSEEMVNNKTISERSERSRGGDRGRGGFSIEPSINLYDFSRAVDEYESGNDKLLREIIIPAEIVSEVYPEVQVKKENLKKIFTGKPIHDKDLKKKVKFETGEIISVFSDEKFIGMYSVINGKEIFAKAKFVLQEIK